MATLAGGSEKIRELHVSVGYNPLGSSLEWDRAQGRRKLPSGRFGGGEGPREQVREGRARAEERIAEIMAEVAEWATGEYAAAGFSKIRVEVGAKVGSRQVLRLTGPDAERLGRILENDTSGRDMHGFIQGARRKREIQVTRKIKTKKGERTAPRGKKTEREGGYYVIVPVVHGTVTRTASGKFEFTGRGGVQLSRTNQDALKQFEAVPEAEDYRTTHDDPAQLTEYLTGAVTERYTPTREGGRTVQKYSVEHETELGNPLWEVVKYAQQVRKAGEFDKEKKRQLQQKNAPYGRPTQENPQTLRGGQKRSNKRGGELLSFLGAQNLKVNSPEAGLKVGSASAQATAERQKGQVVSFMTLSTRQPNRQLPGRKGLHILKRAEEGIRDYLQAEIAAVRSRLTGHGGYAQRAYLEVLESAAR